MFTDEATVHTNGRVKGHDIWTPCEHVRDSPKVNLWCGIMHDRVRGHFFFVADTVTVKVLSG